MKTTIIRKNRNYIRRIATVTLMIFALYNLVKFLRYPSEYTYFFLPTKNVVIIFSIVGLISCCLVIFLIIKSVFAKEAFLRIDREGIFNGFFLYDKKEIKWKEISKIKTIKYNYNSYIAIFLNETLNNEKGINSFFFKMNEKSMGTPYIINSGDLDCTFEKLERLILEAYKKSK